MVTPNTLLEYRLDGRVVPEAMTGDQMLDKRWEPSKVIALHWDCCGMSVDLHTPYGFAAEFVPSRENVAVLGETVATGECSLLRVYASSGAPERSFLTLAEIIGGGQTGEFLGLRSQPAICQRRSPRFSGRVAATFRWTSTPLPATCWASVRSAKLVALLIMG